MSGGTKPNSSLTNHYSRTIGQNSMAARPIAGLDSGCIVPSWEMKNLGSRKNP